MINCPENIYSHKIKIMLLEIRPKVQILLVLMSARRSIGTRKPDKIKLEIYKCYVFSFPKIKNCIKILTNFGESRIFRKSRK